MFAWMLYATLVGLMLAAAGALLEQWSPWLAGRRRFVWLTVIAGTLVLATAVSVAPGERSPSIAPATLGSVPPGRTIEPPVTSPSVTTATVARLTGADEATLTREAGSFRLDAALIALWIAASALCLLVLAVSAWRVARMQRAWREGIIAGVPVLVSHDVGPAVIGLVHHGIVVPAWVEALREDEQRTVMTHEREHVRAGDPLLLWGATLLVALVPWNAALWYALRRLRHAIEMDCDARVLRTRPDAHAYCTLLLDVGERTLAGVAPVAALAEPATLLERRIDAMTAPRAMGWRVGAGATAALTLVLAACWTPRPTIAPQARVAALVSELNSLLASDSTRRSLSLAEQVEARRTVAAARAMQLHRAAVDPYEWERALAPSADVALKQLYPQLYTRTDTTELMVVLTYDMNGKLKGHELRAQPSWGAYQATDFSRVQIQWFAMRDIPGRHASLVLVLEKWPIDSEPPNSAYGGRNAPAHSANVSPAQQFGHRVDSIAHADFPQAFQKRDDAIVVAVLFGADGTILRTTQKTFALGEVFDVDPGNPNAPLTMRSSSYLLMRTMGSEVPQLSRSGSQTMSEAPHAVFIYGQLVAR